MPNIYSFAYSAVGSTDDGDSFIRQLTDTHSGKTAQASTVPAAKSGTLTTRTDANTGTLTMSSGHGITTGAKISLFWSGGQRRNVTVGTVATNSVPIDLGDGDDLPAASTAITAMVPTELAFPVVGDNITALGATCATQGVVQFMDGSDAELLAYTFTDATAGGGYPWVDGCGVTNPLAGGTVVNVWFSHADSASARVLKAYAGF